MTCLDGNCQGIKIPGNSYHQALLSVCVGVTSAIVNRGQARLAEVMALP